MTTRDFSNFTPACTDHGVAKGCPFDTPYNCETQEFGDHVTKSWKSHLDTFAGQCAVVTGANGGIGRSVIQRFAESGMKVIAIDRTLETAVKATLWLESMKLGSGHLPLGIDLSDAESIKEGLDALRREKASIKVLVNLAGIAEDSRIPMVSQTSLRQHLQVNFEAPMLISQYVSRLMARTGGGSIVNVSSVTATDGNIGQLAYGASKGALNAATKTLSMELAPQSIRVNTVAPGVIDTPMTQSLSHETRVNLLKRVSMNRIGKPEEVANVILWLASSASSYVTGQVLRIDGGM